LHNCNIKVRQYVRHRNVAIGMTNEYARKREIDDSTEGMNEGRKE